MSLDPVIHLDYPLDYDLMLTEAKAAKESAQPYGNDPRYPGWQLDEWLISRYTSDYIQKIMDDFEVKGKPRFYWLEPHFVLPEHVDYNTTCSLNFVLSDDPAPITVEGKDYVYKMALLNTTVLHSVTNGPKERMLFKISIFDESFETLAKKIKFKK